MQSTVTEKQKNILTTTTYIIIFLAGACLYLFAGNFLDKDLREIVKEIGLFIAVSITTHVIYVAFLKTEDLEVISHTLKSVIDKDRNIQQHGLNRISIISYSEILKELQPGDIIYWNDTYTDDFHTLAERIVIETKKGVKFRFLAISPYCENAQQRASELSLSSSAFENFSNGCKSFIDTIQSLIEKTNSTQELKKPENRLIDLRIYTDSPGMPLIIIENDSKLRRAYTGFYLGKPSLNFVHLEWIGETLSDTVYPTSENNVILHELKVYFDKKWERSLEYNMTCPWCGEWNYETIDISDKNLKNSGLCTISESQGSLHINGERLKERKMINGNLIETGCFVKWSTTKALAYKESLSTKIIAYYSIIDPDTGKGLKGILDLTYHKDESNETFNGDYHIYGELESNHINSRDGKITLTKQNESH